MEATQPRQVAHDRPDQLQQIQSGLMPGETLYCVYDGKGAGTGFLAVTDKRVIIEDSLMSEERSR